MRNTHLVIQFFILCASLTLVTADPPAGDPEKDPRMHKLLQDARRLLDGKQAVAAVDQCDKVIANFKAYYGGRKEKIYCARDSAESLLYLLDTAAGATSQLPALADAKPPVKNAACIVLSSTWASAYFLKGYALQDLRRIAEAKAALQLAVELSPANSQYLSELGGICEAEKDWPQASKLFEAAEEHAALMVPEGERARELGRARRGLAYVFVELGKLDEAEQKYRQCLADDPNDTRAKRELEYVRSLRAKAVPH